MKRLMTRKRHRPEEVVAKLREADEAIAQGKSLEDVAKSLGVSLMSLHRWRTEYGSTDRDAMTRMKELQRENTRLKRLVDGSIPRYPYPEEGAQGGIPSPVTSACASRHPTCQRHLRHLAATRMSIA